ncbi:MAG: HepT-like ribonuclease domain-containing protein [bacterium]
MKEELNQRLLQRLNFLESETQDYTRFKHLTREDYFTDRDRRRSVERWVENIINSSIDISKIILTFEGISLPDNYKDIVALLSAVKELKMVDAEALSTWVKFRNIVAHEYLDIRWSSIKRFISETESLYKDFLDKVKIYLEKKITENRES